MAAEEGFDHSGIRVLRGAVEPEVCAAVIRSLGGSTSRLPSGVGRVQDAWRYSRPVRSLACHPTVLAAVAERFGRRPVPFQTLDFDRGTEQRLHSDSVHFDSVPAGWMCGAWVALEDVGADQGPLATVPGSQEASRRVLADFLGRPDGFSMGDYEDALAAELEGMPRVEFTGRVGDAIVWDADVVHGGAPVLQGAGTRWSQVTHYFFAGCTYVTPHLGHPPQSVYMREPVVDISSGRDVRAMLDGEPTRVLRLPGGQTRILAEGSPNTALWQEVASAGRGVVRRQTRRGRWTMQRMRGHGRSIVQRVKSATAVASPRAKRR